MTAVTAFAMTRKGLAVVDAVSRRYPGLIAVVVCARDSAIQDDCYEEIRHTCQSNGIDFQDRRDFKGAATQFAIAISWRWLIASSTANLIVFHDSLLPRYRGFNPLVTALVNGDAHVGVSALYASQDYDRGDIIGAAAIEVSYPSKIRDVIERLCPLYVDLALRVCSEISKGRAPGAVPQDHSAATYSLWRDEQDYLINWSASAMQVRRTVDALGYPYKGAACWVGRTLARVVDASEVDDVVIENREPGKVIFVRDGKPVVVCGSGLLRINEMTDDMGRSLLPLKQFRLRVDRPTG